MGAQWAVRWRLVTGSRDGSGESAAPGGRHEHRRSVMPSMHQLTAAAGTVLATVAVATAPAVGRTHQWTPPKDLRSPDARDAATRRTATTYQDLRSPDTRDAATRPPVLVRVTPAPPASGLNWDSAAIGALAGAGLLISIAGGGLVLVRRRAQVTPPVEPRATHAA
jgi:hypothetical protein